MTTLLKEAFEKASSLPAAAQEELARQMLEDLEGEARWDERLATSQGFLDGMANAALDARRKGRTHRKGFGELRTRS